MPLRHTTAKNITPGVKEKQCHHLPVHYDSLMMPAVDEVAGTESDVMLQDGRAYPTSACQKCMSPEVGSMTCLPIKAYPPL